MLVFYQMEMWELKPPKANQFALTFLNGFPPNKLLIQGREIHLKVLVCTTILYLSARVSKVGLVTREPTQEGWV